MPLPRPSTEGNLLVGVTELADALDRGRAATLAYIILTRAAAQVVPNITVTAISYDTLSGKYDPENILAWDGAALVTPNKPAILIASGEHYPTTGGGTARLSILRMAGTERSRGYMTAALQNCSSSATWVHAAGQSVDHAFYHDVGGNCNVTSILVVVALAP